MKLTTAGESHGKALVAIIEGLPAHLKIDKARADEELKFRQSGFGRARGKKSRRTRLKFSRASGMARHWEVP